MTLQDLRKKFRVVIRHYRLYDNYETLEAIRYSRLSSELRFYMLSKRAIPYIALLQKGGCTTLTLYDHNGEFVAKETAFCSLKDQFCRRTGVEEAIRKLVQKGVV